MEQIKNGDKIKIHYTGRLENGTVFDSSMEKEPIEVKVGEGKIISGLEEALVGMSTGETKTVKLKADEAYGPYRDDMVLTVNREELPENLDPQVGQQLQISKPEGPVFNVRVTDASESSVTLDGNHFLAGKDIIFDLKVVEIQ